MDKITLTLRLSLRMKKAPIPETEADRLRAVQGLNILDTPPDERFDNITKQATNRFKVPISTISIIDKDREWYKSCQGLDHQSGRRDISFCGHALLQEDTLILEDTLDDPRFADNPMVVGPPYIRFYAGKSLYEHDSNQPVGVLCIKDHQPRKMSTQDIADFLDLANQAEEQINARQAPPA